MNRSYIIFINKNLRLHSLFLLLFEDIFNIKMTIICLNSPLCFYHLRIHWVSLSHLIPHLLWHFEDLTIKSQLIDQQSMNVFPLSLEIFINIHLICCSSCNFQVSSPLFFNAEIKVKELILFLLHYFR